MSATEYALTLYYYTSFSTVESNHLDGNYYGVLLETETTGNTFEDNWANANTYGFLTEDDTDGVNAVPDSGPNKFLKNHAFGNSSYDYYDDTTSSDPSTNAGTADYYKGNKGNVAYPAAILSY